MLSSRKLWLAGLGLIAALLLTALPVRAVEPDKLVPSDADIVVVVNIRQALESPLVKAYALDHVKDALKQNDIASNLLKSAGLDPLKDIDSVMITLSGLAPDNKMLIVTRGKFDVDKFQTAAQDYAKANPKELKITTEVGRHVYELIGGDASNFVTFADGKTMLLSNSKAQLLTSLKPEKTGKLNKDMQTALDKIKGGKESLWVALVVTDEMKKSLADNDQTKELAPKLESVTGTLNVAEDVRLAFLINTTDEAAAGKVATLIKGVKPLLGLLAGGQEEIKPAIDLVLQNLTVDSDKKAATLNLKITESMIKKAISDANKPANPPKKEDR